MAHYGADLLTSSQDLLTSLDRSAVALNMIAHTLENEFSERFGHTGVRCSLVCARVHVMCLTWAHVQDAAARPTPWSSPRGCVSFKGAMFVTQQYSTHLYNVATSLALACIPPAVLHAEHIAVQHCKLLSLRVSS